MRFFPVLLIALASAGCGAETADPADAATVTRVDSAGVEIVTSSAPAWQAGEGWSLEGDPFLVIGQSDAAIERSPLDPASVFRARDGSIVVGDGVQVGHNAILVYDSLGRYQRTISREGEGPCEFGQLFWAAAYRGDSIAAFDMAGNEIHIFAADGRCVRSVSVPQGGLPEPRGTYGFAAAAEGVFADGTFLMYGGGAIDIPSGAGVTWYRHHVLRVSPDGLTADTLGLFRIMEQYWDGRQQRERPMGRLTHRAVNGNGLLYATSESFEVEDRNAAGHLSRIMRRAWAVRPLTPDMRSAYIDARYERTKVASFEGGAEAADRARRYLETLEWPAERPSIGGILVDDERHVWVGEYVNRTVLEAESAPSDVAWSVFSPEGAWQGDVRMPARFTPTSIARGIVYGTWRDADDVKSVRAYRIMGR